ncbi:Glycerophosphoryl diester phosphodiesterase [compost metagenome]
MISPEAAEDRILYQKVGGLAVDTGKRSVASAAVADLRDRFRDGRPTAFFKLGDGYGYNRWLAYDDGSYGTAEAFVGPDGMSLSAFDLVVDPSNSFAVRDQFGYYSVRVRSGGNAVAQMPGSELVTMLAKALGDSTIEQGGKLLALRDQYGYYALSLTEDAFAAKGKPAASASGASDQALAVQARRIDDLYGRGELRKMQVAAHRGFSIQAPENTILAFSTALHRGADVLEIDVQFSTDGVPYIFHDNDVDTLTQGTGSFTALSSVQIEALRFKQLVGTALEESVRVPRLSSYLQFVREECAHTFLELKGALTQAQVQQVVDMVIAAGLENMVTVICFTYSYLQMVRAISPTMRVGYLVGSAADFESKVDLAAALAPADISTEAASLLANPGLVAYAHSRGVDVTVWTVFDLATTRQLQRIGVNRFTSDATLRA